MSNLRGGLIMMLIAGLIAGGCQTNSPNMTITEYRPKQQVTERKVAESQVFVLVRWTPIAPISTAATSPTTKPVARQMPVEIEQVFVPRGHRLGFRRTGAQLIAVADADSTPLAEAHYEWKTLPGHIDDQSQENNRRFDQLVGTIAGVALVAGVVVLVLSAVHHNRHSLLDDIFNDGD